MSPLNLLFRGCLLLFISKTTSAQQNQIPLTFEYCAPLAKINTINSNFHEGIKPYYYAEINSLVNLDSINANRTLNFKKANTNKKKYLVLPLLNASVGFEKSNLYQNLFNTSIGAAVNFNYKRKLHFNSYYQADNNKYPTYINTNIIEKNVVPQVGIAYKNGNNYYSRNFGGYLNYAINDIFNVELGHGKNHFGNGYRSLLLSDASNNYSYAKITTSIWKIKYINLYTNFKDFNASGKIPYWKNNNKFGTFHYLSWNVTKRLNLSFFETIIWGAKDTLVNRGFDVNYINPVIFYRPVEYSVGSSDNSLMGLNVRYKITNNIQIYGQLIMDEFLLSAIKTDLRIKTKKLLDKPIDPSVKYGWWANKQGFQMGAKWYNILNVKNLFASLEFNTVRPYTYTHISSLSNYGHLNQPLAHPFGANFKELICIVNYQKKNWNITLENIYALRGLDDASTNFGSNIFKPYTTHTQDYFNFTGQGIKSKMFFTDLKLSYFILPENNLHAFIQIRNRIEKTPNQTFNALMFFAGIKTALFNTYRDY